MIPLFLSIAIALMVATPAVAQDFSSVGDMGISYGAATVNQVIVNSNNNPGLRSGQQPACGLAAGPGARIAPSSAPMRFQSTGATWQQTQAQYLARVEKANPAAGKALADEMARHDLAGIYAGLVAPFGLRADDAADVLAGYTVLGWLIATGASDPDPAAVRAVRDQFAGRLAVAPDFQSPSRRRAVGEELKIAFVTLHSGWQSARREGTLNQYARGVGDLFRRDDIDLRALRLTRDGFVGK